MYGRFCVTLAFSLTVLLYISGFSVFAQQANGASGTLVYDVTAMGASGDGVHDDTIALQNALNQLATTHQEIYFPCGTYIVTSPLTLIAPTQTLQTGSIRGENAACAIIRYTGSTPGPVLTVRTVDITNPSFYFSGFFLSDISIFGNSVTTDDVLLIRPAHFDIESLFTWGANSNSGDCLQIQEGVGGKIDSFSCSGNISQGLPLPAPNVGLNLIGVNATDQTGALTILDPTIEQLKGIGILFRSSSLIFMAGCQTTMNNQSLYIDDNSYKNNILNCLFEESPKASYVGGYSNVLENCTFSYFSGDASTIDLEVGGRQNTVSNTMVQWGTSILPTATQTNMSSDLFGTPPTDSGNGTQITNASYANTQANISYPRSTESNYSQPGFIGAGVTSAQTITGSWVLTPTPATLSYTIFPTGASWRAIFIGKFGGRIPVADLRALPTFLELTESASTVQLSPSMTLRFGINSSGLFSVTGGSGAETFNGTIYLMVDNSSSTSGPSSARFSGSLSATTVSAASLLTFSQPPNGFNHPIGLVGGELGYLYLPFETGTSGVCRGGSVVGGMDDANYGGVYIRAIDSWFYPCGSEKYENTLGVFHDGVKSLAPISAPSAAVGKIQLTETAGKTQCLHVDAAGNVSGTGYDCGDHSGGSSTTRNYYWNQLVSSSSPHRGTKCDRLGYSGSDACQGSVQLPGPMPDSNYFVQCSGLDDERRQLSVGVIGTDVLPTATGGNIYLNVGVIHAFYGDGLRTVMVTCHAHHD
jgi:hypothetical protein